jgi:hypothetical protein
MAIAQVDVRVQVESHEVAGWHPRDRKDFEALLRQQAGRACLDMECFLGTDWSADLTRAADTELEAGLLRLVEWLRANAPWDLRVAVIHTRRWTVDPFALLGAEGAYAPSEFAREGRLFEGGDEELYLLVEVHSREVRARPDSETLIQTLADFAAPTFDALGGTGDVWLSLIGGEDDAALGAQIVRLVEFLRSHAFPPDTRLKVMIERSWWIEVFSPAGPTAG